MLSFTHTLIANRRKWRRGGKWHDFKYFRLTGGLRVGEEGKSNAYEDDRWEKDERKEKDEWEKGIKPRR